jgi:hypothetical protein
MVSKHNMVAAHEGYQEPSRRRHGLLGMDSGKEAVALACNKSTAAMATLQGPRERPAGRGDPIQRRGKSNLNFNS